MIQMCLTYFSVIYALTISTDPTPENGGLYFAEYLTMKNDLQMDLNVYEQAIFEEKLERAKIKEGLYKRDETRIHRSVSHDEITGMIVSSKLLGTNHASKIWEYLKSNFFIYDIDGTRPYPAFHPAWIYFWGEWMEESWTKIFYPLAFINITLATQKGSEGETSGKLLYYTLIKRNSFLWQFYKYRMVRVYGKDWLAKIFKIYYPKEAPDHPLIVLSTELNEKGFLNEKEIEGGEISF